MDSLGSGVRVALTTTVPDPTFGETSSAKPSVSEGRLNLPFDEHQGRVFA